MPQEPIKITPIKITPFSTTPAKIDYSINLNEINLNESDNQEQINDKNKTWLFQKQPSSSLFKAISDLSTDWEAMETPNDFFGETFVNQLKGWSVSIDRIDERFIPYIDATILYRNAGNIDTPYIFVSPTENIFFEVQDIEGEDNIKNLTIRAGLLLFETIPEGTINVLEARLMVKLSDKLNFT